MYCPTLQTGQPGVVAWAIPRARPSGAPTGQLSPQTLQTSGPRPGASGKTLPDGGPMPDGIPPPDV